MENIVFLPGLGCDEAIFAPQIRELEDIFKPQVVTSHFFTSVSDHVNLILEKAPEDFILVGHSLGGWFAQWVALNAPHRVKKLILMSTSTGKLNSDMATFFQQMEMLINPDKTPPFFKKFHPLSFMMSPFEGFKVGEIMENVQQAFPWATTLDKIKKELESRDTRQHLSEIKCETLLLHGKQDAFFAKEMQILRKGLPRNTYIEIDQCGHMLPLEKSSFISSLIRLWLIDSLK